MQPACVVYVVEHNGGNRG